MSINFFQKPPTSVSIEVEDFKVPDDRVIGWGWRGEGNPENYYKVALDFSKSIGRKVVIYGSHGEGSDRDWNPSIIKEAQKQDRYLLSLWGGFWIRGKTKKLRNCPEKLLGISVPCRDYVGKIPKDIPIDFVIMDAASRFPMAFVYFNYLGITFDIYHNRGNEGVKLFKEILTAASKILKRESEEKSIPERWDDFSAFKSVMVESISSELKDIEEKRKRVADELTRAAKEYSKATRDYQVVCSRKEQLEMKSGSVATAIDQQITRIKTLESFNGIKALYKDKFIFRTRPFVIQDPRTERYHILGPYEVKVNWGEGDIRITGPRPKGHGYGGSRSRLTCHPHVLDQGPERDGEQDICFGSAGESIMKAMGSKDLVGIIFLISQYLGQAQVKDPAGWYLHRYPVYDIIKKKVVSPPRDNWYTCSKDCDGCGSLEECIKAKMKPGTF